MELGHAVLEVSIGEAALNIIEAEDIDVLMADMVHSTAGKLLRSPTHPLKTDGPRCEIPLQ